MIEKHRLPIDTPPPGIYLPGPEDLAALSAAYALTADGYRAAGMADQARNFDLISELLRNQANPNRNWPQANSD